MFRTGQLSTEDEVKIPENEYANHSMILAISRISIKKDCRDPSNILRQNILYY
jgi:hypothetical protein